MTDTKYPLELDAQQLTKRDLVLMLESYRNMVEAYLSVLSKMEESDEKLKQLIVEIKNGFKRVGDDCEKCKEKQWDYHSIIAEALKTEHDENSRSRSSVGTKLYGVIAGLVVIITGLITVIVTLVSQMK